MTTWEKGFQAEGMTSAKVLGQEYALCVQRRARTSVDGVSDVGIGG